MTAADRLRKEGFEKGYQQGFEIGFEIGLLLHFRFEDQSQELMKLVSQIQDIAKLREIKKAIINVKDASELRLILEH